MSVRVGDMVKWTLVWSLCLAFPLLLSACVRLNVDLSELYGTYLAEYSFGTEKIMLRENGDYVQEVTIISLNKTITHSGEWSYDPDTERVNLKRCLSVNDGFGRLRDRYSTPLEGGCSLPVERRFFLFGQLRLGPDEGNPYYKL